MAEARHLSADDDGIRKRGKDERQCSYTESRRIEVSVVDGDGLITVHSVVERARVVVSQPCNR